MSTNFYLAAPHLDEFKDEEDDYGIHIGKWCMGWTFSWRAHDDLGLVTRDAWEEFMKNQGDVGIITEYGSPRTFSEFRECSYIERRDPNRCLRRPQSSPHYRQSVDQHGETFSHYWFC